MLHNVLQFGFVGLMVLSVAGAWLSRAKRGSFVLGALSAMCAAIAAHYYVFWALATFGLGFVWAMFAATSMIDLAWRVKTGFVIFLGLGALLCIYPTYYDERYGHAAVDTSLSKEQLADIESQDKRGDHGLSAFLRANIPFRLVRGLDLKGGLRLVYTVDVDEAIKDKRDRYYDELRGALATALGFHSGDKPPTVDELSKLPTKVAVTKSRDQAGVITLTFVDPADSAKVDDAFLKRFIAELAVLRSADRKTITFRIRSDRETDIRSHAVDQAKDTVRRRVDELGVKEASVTVRDEDIIIEVPGEDEASFARMRDIVSQTARLEFKMVDDDDDFFAPYVMKKEGLPVGLTFSIENAPVGPGKTKPVHYARLVKNEHEDMRSALQRMKDWVATLPVDPDHEIGFEKAFEYNEEKDAQEEIGWRTYYLYSKAEITGDMVRDAQAQSDAGDRGVGGWFVSMDMTPRGGDLFEEVTGSHVKRRFAIILDGKVESAPRIEGKIGGGRCRITMGQGAADQQLQNAKKLEVVLRAGALPAPISPSYEQHIGPSLGKDSIGQGLKGAAFGMGLVLVFMVMYYSRAGMIANICVLFNLVLQVAVLAMLGASMTLPGIAGLALTVGIAVDANVLINERIREELRHGKSPRAAVDVGYDKAFTAILDGHVTTLISGVILGQYGTGPIKGFAVTLFIGVAVSLFTGVVCTRLMFDWAVRHRKVKTLSLG